MFRVTAVAQLLLLAGLLLSGCVMAGVVKETVIYLQQDGRNFLTYSTVRSDWPSYDLYLQKRQSLDDFLYIYPNDYRWDPSSDEGANILHFTQADYALIEPGKWETEVTQDATGSYHFKSDSGAPRADGHFGYWTRPGEFEQFVYVWVLPANFDVVSYQANVAGEWVLRRNTLAFYARGVNDLLFEISYRPRSHSLYTQMVQALDGLAEVQVELQDNGVRLVLGEGLLFPTGASVLSAAGRAAVERISKTLQRHPGIELIVSGHSDNLPLKRSLQHIYHSNWGLSSARALAVVQQLLDGGLAGERIRAQAFGPHRPVADNRSAEGRAKNRRIELELVQQSN